MNAAAPPGLQILVLAAGFSSRLGRPKALLRIRGSSLLRRTLNLAALLSAARIILVVPPRAARYRVETRGLRIVFALNPERAAGLSSSVRRGILRARYSPALLLLPVDLAVLKRRELARLIFRWRANRRCVIARRIELPDGRSKGGIPLILPRWLYARALGVRGDIGLRELVDAIPPQQRVLVDAQSAQFDVDTPRDLSAARRRRG